MKYKYEDLLRVKELIREYYRTEEYHSEFEQYGDRYCLPLRYLLDHIDLGDRLYDMFGGNDFDKIQINISQDSGEEIRLCYVLEGYTNIVEAINHILNEWKESKLVFSIRYDVVEKFEVSNNLINESEVTNKLYELGLSKDFSWTREGNHVILIKEGEYCEEYEQSIINEDDIACLGCDRVIYINEVKDNLYKVYTEGK